MGRNLAPNENIYVITGTYGKSNNQVAVTNGTIPAGGGAPAANYTCSPDLLGISYTGEAKYQITIPACFYKILYDPQNHETIAYLMPNQNTQNAAVVPWANKNWGLYAITVDDLQKRMEAAVDDPKQGRQNYYFSFFDTAPAAPVINKGWPAIGATHPLANLGPANNTVTIISALGAGAGTLAPPGGGAVGGTPIWYANPTGIPPAVRMNLYPLGPMAPTAAGAAGAGTPSVSFPGC